MSKFGKYEYLLQRDKLILTERVHYRRILGYLTLASGALTTYIITFEPHSVGNAFTSASDRQVLLAGKWIQAITFTAIGIVGVFFTPATKITVHYAAETLKIGSSNPIPLDDLTVETFRDALSYTVTFKNKGDFCWSISTNRQQELEPFLEQLRLLGLDTDQVDTKSKRTQIYPKEPDARHLSRPHSALEAESTTANHRTP